MKTLPYLLLAVSLCVLGNGCASPGVPLHITEIHANQIQAETSEYNGLSASLATNLFHDVVNRLGYVVYQHQYHDPTNPTWIEYTAYFTPKGATSVFLALEMDGKHVVFRGSTDMRPKSPGALELQRAMTLFQEALDKRQIKHTIETIETHGGPGPGAA